MFISTGHVICDSLWHFGLAQVMKPWQMGGRSPPGSSELKSRGTVCWRDIQNFQTRSDAWELAVFHLWAWVVVKRWLIFQVLPADEGLEQSCHSNTDSWIGTMLSILYELSLNPQKYPVGLDTTLSLFYGWEQVKEDYQVGQGHISYVKHKTLH